MQVILDSRVLWHQYYSISILAINICCVNKNVMSISFEEVKEKSNKKLYFKVPKRLFCLYNFVNQIMQDNFFLKTERCQKIIPSVLLTPFLSQWRPWLPHLHHQQWRPLCTLRIKTVVSTSSYLSPPLSKSLSTSSAVPKAFPLP